MQSKPLIGIVLIVLGLILIYIGWRGLGVVTSYIAKKVP